MNIDITIFARVDTFMHKINFIKHYALNKFSKIYLNYTTLRKLAELVK